MAGYTRPSGSANIANGNIIDATDLNGEFDTLEGAFNSSSGHSHDGTAGGGARITETGPGGQYTFTTNRMEPASGQSLEIGADTNRFTNAYFNGTTGVKTLNLNVETSGTIASLIVGTSSAVTSVEDGFSSISANHDQLVSAKAVKDYVDSQVTAQDLDITDGTNTGSVDLDSASLTFTGSTGIGAVVSNGTVTFTTTDSEIVHDNLSGFVEDEHVDHSNVLISSGNGLTGGGNITTSRTLSVDPHTGIAVTTDGVALSHLGLESLTDPNADRVAFWDDSEGAFKWLTMGSNLSITDTTLNATDTNTTYSTATSSVEGLVEIFSDTTQTVAAQTITSTSGRTYGSQLNSANQLVVNVPWTDTTYSTATDSALGLVKLGSSTAQTTAPESVTTTSNRSYAVQLDSNSKMVVNVPWVDTNDNTTYSAGTGLTLDGTTFKTNVSSTAQTVAANTLTATNNRTYAIQVTSNDDLVVNVPWENTNTVYSAGTGVTLTNTTFSIGQDVGTSDNVQFNNVTVSGDLTVSGTTTTVNTETINLADNQIVLNSNFDGATPTEDGGIEIERGDEANKTLVWDETNDKWTIGSETFVVGGLEGNSSSDLTLSTDEVMVFKSADTSNVGNPVFNFQHTSSANVAAPPQLNIKNTDTATSADQLIGEFRFVASDSLGNYVDYASFKSTILDNTSATRDGSFVMTVSDDGANDLEVFSAGGGQSTIIQSGVGNISLKAGTTTMTNSAGTGNLTFTPNSSSQVISAQTDLRLTGTDIRIDATTNVKLEGTTTDVFGDLVLSKGASDWKVEVGTSNELNIYYGSTRLFELDSSGNLTVRGNVVAFDTSL